MDELKAIFLGLVGHKNEDNLPIIYMVAENNNINKEIVVSFSKQILANPSMMEVNLQTNVAQVDGAKESLANLLSELVNAGAVKSKEKYLTLIG